VKIELEETVNRLMQDGTERVARQAPDEKKARPKCSACVGRATLEGSRAAAALGEFTPMAILR
jgi:hypothetical protein